MKCKSAIVLFLLFSRVTADDRCLVLSRLPNDQQCAIRVLEDASKCGVFDGRIDKEINCRDSPNLPEFACICETEDCPKSTTDIIEKMDIQVSLIELFNTLVHPLHACIATAVVQYPDREPVAGPSTATEQAELDLATSSSLSGDRESSSPSFPSEHASPRPLTDGLSTSSPSSSSADPESSPSEQNMAEGDSTSEEPISSTSSPTTVSESRIEDEGSDEITTSPSYQSTRIVDNTYSTAPYSTMSTGTAPEFEGKATDYTWIYVVVSLILALVALSTIGGGLYCKLRKKPRKTTVAAKPRVEKKANQRQAEGTVATPAEVRIEIPAERPSIPVKDTAPPLPDIAPINQSLTGTTGPMGSPNEDDLNTAGSTITECEISISTTMTEETTGGSGTSGL